MKQLSTRILGGSGVSQFPLVQAAESGMAALAMVANFYGMNVDVPRLRVRFPPSPRGASSVAEMVRMSDNIGLACRVLEIPVDKLAQLRLPAILQWDTEHFVVLKTIKSRMAEIYDPRGGSAWFKLEALNDHFTGISLEAWPSREFVLLERRPRLKLQQLWSRVDGLVTALTQTFLLSLVLEAFVLASPYYMQLALDNVLPSLDYDLLTLLAIGFAVFTLVNAAASLLRSFVLLSSGASLGLGIAINIARRLFRLPVAWFERRQIGDVLSRFQSIAPIRSALTDGSVASVLDGAFAALIFVVMLFYSGQLTILVTASVMLYVLVRLISFNAQRRAQEKIIVASGREQSILIESLRGIVTLRLFNREAARVAQWQSKNVDTANAAIGLSRITIWQTTASGVIFGLENIASVWISIRLVMSGGFSIGMVFAFVAFKSQFIRRISSLIENGILFRMLGLHLERLSDIALADEDLSFKTADRPRLAYSGRIELKDVYFQYSEDRPMVLRGLNFAVSAGEHVAITGPSGCGKSTVLKILLGLEEPNSGSVLIDELPLARFGHKNFHEQASAVLQDDSLFAGTLSENIALFDEHIDRDRMISASQAAAIHHEIIEMPLGYETLVGEMGTALSGGQRQRVLLARSLYRCPRLLVMDEGTSQLDVDREREINAMISKMGITRIIIAHRQETIRSAEKIFLMKDGALVDVTADWLGR